MTDIETADRLYREFPDFAAWWGLGATDIELWRRFAENLAAKRAAARPEAFGKAVEVAMRAAAIDTGAIEGLYTVDRGFTMAVALQSFAWQHMIDERGPRVGDLFRAQLAAYELVLDAATRALPISEAWIRALHEKVCAAQPTYPVLTPQGWQDHALATGRYKDRPNHVRLATGGILAFAPVERVAAAMHRLVEEIRNPAFAAAHPALQASYVHYALVNIHPFADGNGRVARALAAVFFHRFASIPFVVFSDQRGVYLDALRAADEGKAAPTIAFFRDRGIDTMQRLAESLSTPELRQPDEVGEGTARPSTGRELVALRLQAAIEETLGARLAALSRASTIAASLETERRYGWSRDDDWRVPSSCALLDLRTLGAPSVHAEARFQTLVAAAPSAVFAFRLTGPGADDFLDARWEDAAPEVTPRLRDRIDQWIDRQLGRALGELRPA